MGYVLLTLASPGQVLSALYHSEGEINLYAFLPRFPTSKSHWSRNNVRLAQVYLLRLLGSR